MNWFHWLVPHRLRDLAKTSDEEKQATQRRVDVARQLLEVAAARGEARAYGKHTNGDRRTTT